jgi:chorismate dehydratase
MSGTRAAVATIARIPYLNSEPFYAQWHAAPGTSVDLPPRALGEAARDGQADAGLMACADWFALDPTFERVANFGISCRGAVDSVLLFAMRPFERLDGATVDLTEHSQTSVALTRILLAARYGLMGVTYRRRAIEAGVPPAGDAWLLIGDAAIAARRSWLAAGGATSGVHVLDLGQAWEEWTGLPFVYAVWAVRAALPADERARLAAFLESSLAAGEKDLAGIGARYAAVAPELGDADELARYLARFRYRLGPDEERGLDRFRALWKEHCLDA